MTVLCILEPLSVDTEANIILHRLRLLSLRYISAPVEDHFVLQFYRRCEANVNANAIRIAS